MRVLFILDVYFPRVNGVSTSIATFRADLSAAGVATTLVVPQYAAAPAVADDADVIRVPPAFRSSRPITPSSRNTCTTMCRYCRAPWVGGWRAR